MIELDPQSSAPNFRVVDDKNKNIISLAEFELIGTYRRFITEAVKDIERDSTRSERVKEMARTLTLARAAGVVIPDKILESNSSKNVELKMSLKILLENKRKVEGLPDGEYKTYIIEVMDLVESILIGELLQTTGSIKITKESRKAMLFGLAVPNWMYGKVITKDWVRDDIREAKDLLFPKNNFLKGVSLTVKELADADFVSLNEVITRYSLATIKIFETSLPNLVPHTHPDANISEQLTKVFEEFPVVLHDGCVETIFETREAGKGPPSMTVLKPRAEGKETKKEGELPRLRRELQNFLFKLTQTWEMLTRGIIMVDDSVAQFWEHIYPNSPNWEITPSKNLYEWIREVDPNLEEFGKIVRLSDDEIRNRLYAAFAAKMDIFDENLYNEFHAIVEPVLARAGALYTARTGVVRGNLPTDVRSSDLEDLTGTTEAQRNAAKVFLNFKDKTKKGKQTRANRVLLGKEVGELLENLTELKNGRELRDAVTDWMAKTFTTATKEVRLIIAELVVAAALSDEVLVVQDGDESEEESDHE